MSDYVHGTEPEEQARLGLMNRLINPGCLRELALQGGERVLEVGAGLGHFAAAMAAEVGSSGRVVAVERDQRQIAAAGGVTGERSFELRQGDATALPLSDDERGGFDLAHCRFVLEHVPRPELVVAEMVRAVRPGGRVVLADDDHDVVRVWPEVPGFLELWAAYTRLQDRMGTDPLVGRRLVSLLHAAGARPRRTALVFYGGCAGSPEFEGLIANLVAVFSGVRARLFEAGFYRADAFDRVLEAVAAWARLPDAALWYSISWAEGVRPSA